MGGFSIPNPLSKGAPDAPDYKGASAEATRNSRPNQTTPFASSQWSQDPKSGMWSQNVGLNGPLAGLNNQLGSQAAGAWGTPLDNGQQARQHAEDAIYQRGASRLDPMWAQREHGFNSDLANQGIDPNSEAYAKASGNFGRDRNDAYSSLLRDSIMGGGQEAQRQQGMDLQSRMAPLGAMGLLQGLMGMPNFQTGGNPLAAAGMQGQYGMDAANYNRSFWKDLMGGGMNIAAMAA